MEKVEINVVVPIFNEEDSLPAFHQRLRAVLERLDRPWKIIYVDDGSSDHTQEILVGLAEDRRITVVRFSRNFGHQAALTAGLDLAEGEFVITLDGDGQHPPELIPDMIEKYNHGYAIVQMQRQDDINTPLLKRTSSRIFYSILSKFSEIQITPGTSDFRLVSHQVVLVLRKFRESHRFIRGIMPWIGFPIVYISYLAEDRIGGKSKYTLKKMFSLAENAIFSFSLVPLRVGLAAGLFFILLAILEAIYVLSFWLTGRQDILVPGWSSTVFLILITGGFLMVLISLLGLYIGQIFQEIKGRPLYIIQEIYNQD